MSLIWLFLLSPLLKYLTIYGMVAAGGIALYLLTPAWFPGRFRNAAGIVGLCALVAGSHYAWAFHAGETHMAQRIAARDKAAVDRVFAAEKDVDACNGGVDWDATVGSCTR